MLNTFTIFNQSVRELSGEFKQKQAIFLEQLNYLNEELTEFNKKDKDLTDLEQRINNYRDIIQEQMRKNATLSPEEIENMRKELHSFVKQKKTRTQGKSTGAETIDETLRILYIVERLFALSDMSMEVYKQVKYIDEKVQLAYDAITNAKDELDMWKQHEQNIYNIVFPQIREIEDSFNSVVLGMQGKTSIEFDSNKWQIQNMLRDVKVLFRRLSKDFSVQDALLRTTEKIDEGITVLMDIYERIESYIEGVKFSTFLVSINSGHSRVSLTTDNEVMNEAITRLNQIVQTNFVLERYDEVVHAFKQHQFPFAHFYMESFNMPKDLQLNDSESMIQKAVDHVEDLREQMKSTKMVINKYDHEVFRDIDFGSNDSSTAGPFFVWTNAEFKQDIEKLLNGEEVVLKADISKGIEENGVKFNQIGINFKAVKNQAELDAELEHFGVTMAMTDRNYYRCDSRIYSILVDDNVVLDYTMKRHANGEPKASNHVYDKLSDKNCFLSPYTTWSIKLRKLSEKEGDFGQLKKFANQAIDLELIGHGQYVKMHGLVSKEVCDEKLDEYYHFEKVIS